MSIFFTDKIANCSKIIHYIVSILFFYHIYSYIYLSTILAISLQYYLKNEVGCREKINWAYGITI